MRTEFANVIIKTSDGKTRDFGLKIDENGLLIHVGSPLFVAADLETAGVTAPTPNLKPEEYDPEILKHALHLDSPRVTLVDDKYADKVKRMLAGEPEDTRERQNAFLREKGYRWEKKQLYFFGPGEFDDVWVLRGPDGDLVIDAKVAISGEESIQTGTTVKALLTELGYYGQDAIEKAKAEAETRKERRKMREKVDAYFADDSNRTGEKFENAEPHFTARPLTIEKHYPRRQFRIEKDCIWHEEWNSSDGDMWSLNNSDYGFASQFKFDAEIADCLRKLAS